MTTATSGFWSGVIGVVVLLMVGCEQGSSTAPPDSPTIPASPDANDTTIAVEGMRKWYFDRYSFSEYLNTVSLSVAGLDPDMSVDVWIDSVYEGRFEGVSANVAIDIALSPTHRLGEHCLLLSSPRADMAFYAASFYLSAPYCVSVSNDWDIPQSGASFDSNLVLSDTLHSRHPYLRQTHFVGPYAFTDPSISPVRKQWLADWCRHARDSYDDEIGLHIHPYSHFVNCAGVTFRGDSSFFGGEDTTGYTIGLYRYDEDETGKLLATADSVFAAWELGKPVSFRAGGWMAALHTLRALEQQGFTVDASGCNLSRGEEFWHLPLADWLGEKWAGVGDTTQPWYPSRSCIRDTAAPVLGILEAPDNGILADYVDSTEMVALFHAIWPGGWLSQPRHFSIGYHPITLDRTYQRLHGALTALDQFCAVDDLGPVFYVRMDELPRVWPRAF